jgi:hypothetical protein
MARGNKEYWQSVKYESHMSLFRTGLLDLLSDAFLIPSIHESDIHQWLSRLHSVIQVPTASDSPIRLFHVSFCDFCLTDEGEVTQPFLLTENRHMVDFYSSAFKLWVRLSTAICVIFDIRESLSVR